MKAPSICLTTTQTLSSACSISFTLECMTPDFRLKRSSLRSVVPFGVLLHAALSTLKRLLRGKNQMLTNSTERRQDSDQDARLQNLQAYLL